VLLCLPAPAPAHAALCRECRPSANCSIIFLLNAGISAGFLLVINPLSTTTSRSTQRAPALIKSLFNDGHEVIVLPFTTSESINVHGA
jgi:hypothetical protein